MAAVEAADAGAPSSSSSYHHRWRACSLAWGLQHGPLCDKPRPVRLRPPCWQGVPRIVLTARKYGVHVEPASGEPPPSSPLRSFHRSEDSSVRLLGSAVRPSPAGRDEGRGREAYARHATELVPAAGARRTPGSTKRGGRASVGRRRQQHRVQLQESDHACSSAPPTERCANPQADQWGECWGNCARAGRGAKCGASIARVLVVDRIEGTATVGQPQLLRPPSLRPAPPTRRDCLANHPPRFRRLFFFLSPSYLFLSATVPASHRLNKSFPGTARGGSLRG